MKFTQTGLSQPILNVLQRKRILDPTPIQEQSIKPILQGDDVLGIAKTGTGKTLAFVLPILQQLVDTGNRDTAAALIITPTRELAGQIEEAIRWFEHATRIRSTVIVGGASENKQVQALRRRPQIVVATPGRLQDLLDQKKIRLDRVKHIVLDEADRMLDMGFAPQVNKILKHVPGPDQRQLLLFSATMPDAILNIVNTMMSSPVRIEIAASGSTVEATKQEVVILEEDHRKDALLELLNAAKGTVLVFMRTKHKAKRLNKWLRSNGYASEELHGNQSLSQRKRALEAIMTQRSRIMVATDIAARGIDIPHVELVINFHLPNTAEDYVHRIGRTGRAGRPGWAISFVGTDQAGELHEIQRLINMRIAQKQLQTVPSAALLQAPGGNSQGGNKKRRKPRRRRSAGTHRGGQQDRNSGYPGSQHTGGTQTQGSRTHSRGNRNNRQRQQRSSKHARIYT